MRRITFTQIRYGVELIDPIEGQDPVRTLVFEEPNSRDIYEIPMSDDEALNLARQLAQPRNQAPDAAEPAAEPVPQIVGGPQES